MSPGLGACTAIAAWKEAGPRCGLPGLPHGYLQFNLAGLQGHRHLFGQMPVLILLGRCFLDVTDI